MEIHDISIRDNIFFSFQAQFSNVADSRPAAMRDKILPIGHVGFHKTFDKIRMNDTGRIRGFSAFRYCPGSGLGLTGK